MVAKNARMSLISLAEGSAWQASADSGVGLFYSPAQPFCAATAGPSALSTQPCRR